MKEPWQLDETTAQLLRDKNDQYEGLMMFLTANQRQLLIAIAREGLVRQPLATAFLKEHDLPSASSVKKALNMLTDKDLVYHSPEGYSIYDHFMRQWLCRL